MRTRDRLAIAVAECLGIAKRPRAENGQVMVLAAVGMVAICGMAGFAIDVGSWYQTQRKQQAIADAAALAAAGDLPTNTARAGADAAAYASKNGGSVYAISYSSANLPNDTVTVETQATAPSYFLKVLGINSANVTATAVARSETLSSAWGSAPFAVISSQPELSGCGGPCYGNPTTLDMSKVGAGSFQIINIDGSSGGSGQTILAGWIQNGCSCETSAPTWLYSDTGAKFNSSEVKSAMDARIGSNLLFPIYDTTKGTGSNLQYHVIGFAGFNVTGYQFKGNGGTITGSFVKVDWLGSGTNNTSTYYGATTTQLVG